MAKRRAQPASSSAPERSPWEGWLEEDTSEPAGDPWVGLTGEVDPELAREMAEAERVWRTIHRPRGEAPSSPSTSKGPWGNLSDLTSHPWARYTRLQHTRGPIAPPRRFGPVRTSPVVFKAPPKAHMPYSGTASQDVPYRRETEQVGEGAPSAPRVVPTEEPVPPSTEGVGPMAPSGEDADVTVAPVAMSGAPPADRPDLAEPPLIPDPTPGMAGVPPVVAPIPPLRSPPPRWGDLESDTPSTPAATSTMEAEMGTEVGEEAKAEPSGTRPAGSRRRSRKAKPQPAETAARRAVKAKGTVPEDSARPPSTAESSGDVPAPRAMEVEGGPCRTGAWGCYRRERAGTTRDGGSCRCGDV